MPLPSYVVVTPARNESEFVELALKSMICQTALPLKWVIVSDGSTDGTDSIVERYAAEYSWIELVHIPERSERDFAAKVTAFNAGFERVRGLDYDIVACMDADISFDKDYFVYLLQKLADDSALGVVGTPFQELNRQVYDYRFVSIEHVSGACQLFRRECFDAIGGYVPIKGGSVDHVAVLTARMKGWKTRTFTGQDMCASPRGWHCAGKYHSRKIQVWYEGLRHRQRACLGTVSERVPDGQASGVGGRFSTRGRISLGVVAQHRKTRLP